MIIQLTEVPELVPCGGDCYGDFEWELVQYCIDTDVSGGSVLAYVESSGIEIDSVEQMPSQDEIVMGFKAYATYVAENNHDPLGIADIIGIKIENQEGEE